MPAGSIAGASISHASISRASSTGNFIAGKHRFQASLPSIAGNFNAGNFIAGKFIAGKLIARASRD
jgi:hypothetical protein